MTHTPLHHAEILQDRFGLKVASRLSQGAAELPHDLSERLRVARLQAVAQRKRAPVRQSRAASSVSANGGSAALSWRRGLEPVERPGVCAAAAGPGGRSGVHQRHRQ